MSFPLPHPNNNNQKHHLYHTRIRSQNHIHSLSYSCTQLSTAPQYAYHPSPSPKTCTCTLPTILCIRSRVNIVKMLEIKTETRARSHRPPRKCHAHATHAHSLRSNADCVSWRVEVVLSVWVCASVCFCGPLTQSTKNRLSFCMLFLELSGVGEHFCLKHTCTKFFSVRRWCVAFSSARSDVRAAASSS